jgi:hypothetical protein
LPLDLGPMKIIKLEDARKNTWNKSQPFPVISTIPLSYMYIPSIHAWNSIEHVITLGKSIVGASYSIPSSGVMVLLVGWTIS